MSPCLLPVLLALALAGTEEPRDVSRQRVARDYLRQGQEAFLRERFEEASRSLEMALLVGRFAFGEEELVGEALHLSSLAALRGGRTTPALSHARQYLAWAKERRAPRHLARASNDLTEALLAITALEAARASLEEAIAAGASADPAEALRTRDLERRLAAPAPSPAGAAAAEVVASASLPPGVRAGTSPMVRLPAGSEAGSSAFYLDRHEVTNGEFAAFVAATGYPSEGGWARFAGPGLETHPVRGVAGNDAAAYARWAGKRLPGEAEWERAARGPAGWRYAFGDRFDPRQARVDREPGAGPAPVESHPPSPWGIFDLTGNVQEWCTSRPGTIDVLKGGAWDSGATEALSAQRLALPAGQALASTGFRCARDAE